MGARTGSFSPGKYSEMKLVNLKGARVALEELGLA